MNRAVASLIIVLIFFSFKMYGAWQSNKADEIIQYQDSLMRNIQSNGPQVETFFTSSFQQLSTGRLASTPLRQQIKAIEEQYQKLIDESSKIKIPRGQTPRELLNAYRELLQTERKDIVSRMNKIVQIIETPSGSTMTKGQEIRKLIKEGSDESEHFPEKFREIQRKLAAEYGYHLEKAAD